MERSLEKMPDETRKTMEGYNSEDCFSAAALRDWLEIERQKLMARGMSPPRFSDRDENASEDTGEQQTRVAELVEQLTRQVPADSEERTEAQQGRWLLAQLVEWPCGKGKAKTWRYFTRR